MRLRVSVPFLSGRCLLVGTGATTTVPLILRFQSPSYRGVVSLAKYIFVTRVTYNWRFQSPSYRGVVYLSDPQPNVSVTSMLVSQSPFLSGRCLLGDPDMGVQGRRPNYRFQSPSYRGVVYFRRLS